MSIQEFTQNLVSSKLKKLNDFFLSKLNKINELINIV